MHVNITDGHDRLSIPMSSNGEAEMNGDTSYEGAKRMF